MNARGRCLLVFLLACIAGHAPAGAKPAQQGFELKAVRAPKPPVIDGVVDSDEWGGDRQSAYYFQTNVLGTQSDGRIVDDGRQTDSNWDAPWRSAARRTEFGWTAEIEIPLTSIKYAAGDNRWGGTADHSLRLLADPAGHIDGLAGWN